MKVSMILAGMVVFCSAHMIVEVLRIECVLLKKAVRSVVGPLTFCFVLVSYQGWIPHWGPARDSSVAESTARIVSASSAEAVTPSASPALLPRLASKLNRRVEVVTR
jgi:hypothetical protein